MQSKAQSQQARFTKILERSNQKLFGQKRAKGGVDNMKQDRKSQIDNGSNSQLHAGAKQLYQDDRHSDAPKQADHL